VGESWKNRFLFARVQSTTRITTFILKTIARNKHYQILEINTILIFYNDNIIVFYNKNNINHKDKSNKKTNNSYIIKN